MSTIMPALWSSGPTLLLRGPASDLLIVPTGRVPAILRAAPGVRAVPLGEAMALAGQAAGLQSVRAFYLAWQAAPLASATPQPLLARLRRDIAAGQLTVIRLPHDQTAIARIEKPATSTLTAPAGPVSGWTVRQRIAAMLLRCPKYMPEAMGRAVLAFFTPANLAIMVGFFLLIAGIQALPIADGVADAIILVIAWATLGWQGLIAAKNLTAAVIAAARAQTEPELDDAARRAAEAIIALGGVAFLGRLLARVRTAEPGATTGEAGAGGGDSAPPPSARAARAMDRKRDQLFPEDGKPPPEEPPPEKPPVTETRNGYTYTFDDQGRVTSVEGDLTSNPGQGRNPAAQLRAGGADRLSTDEGGHFVGRRFDGPLDDFNHFAQDRNFNRGAYKSLENQWQKALDNGSTVHVKIVPKYVGDSLRPDSMNVISTIDGVPSRVRFVNQPGG